MEPVTIECTLCHKRYKLDLEKMRQMGVLNPACPACKTPLPVDMPPPPPAAPMSITGQIAVGAVRQAAAGAAAAPIPPPAQPSVPPSRPPGRMITDSDPTGDVTPEAMQRAMNYQPTPPKPPPPVPPAAPPQPTPPAAPAAPPPEAEPDFDAPDIGESTISSAMMASQLAKASALPAGWNFTLSCMDGPVAGQKLVLSQKRCVIGRRKGDFVLTGDGEASSEHAAVEIRGLNQYSLVDLGSTNGTFLNDKKVTGSVPLNDRDVIRIGSSVLLFVVTQIQEEHPQPPPVVTGPVPSVLPPPPGSVSSVAPAPAPVPPPETEPVIEGLPAYLPKPTPVPPNYRFYLKFMEGDMTGEVFEMKGGRGYTLGRSRDCDVPLGDIKASRTHTRIFILGVDKYFVQDLGSTNGSFLNEQKVLDILPLKNQDQVRVGLTKMKFIVLKLPPGQGTI